MSEASRAYLAELEAEAKLGSGMLTRRFLPVFASDDPRLDAIPDADLARLRGHFLAAMTQKPARQVDEKTMLSAAEVAAFRRQFKAAGAAILADGEITPETRALLRYLCPFCDDDGGIAAEDADLEAPPALPGTAGRLRTDES